MSIKFKRKIAKMGPKRLVIIPTVFEGIIEPGQEYIVTLTRTKRGGG